MGHPAVSAVLKSRPTRVRGVLVGVVVALAALVLGAPAAYANVPIDTVATSLSRSPVYVEGGNEAQVTPDDYARLLTDVQAAGTPLYVAVIDSDSLGGLTIAEYTHALGAKVGVMGTYAVVAGRQFFADSQLFPVGALATQAVQDNRAGGANAILDAFIAGVGDLAAAGDSVPGTVPGSVPATDGGGGSLLPVLLVGGVVVVGALVIGTAATRASRKRTAEQLAAVRTVVDEDVTEFGEQVTAVDASDTRLDDSGRADLSAALTAYDTAKSRAEGMRSAQDASLVTQALEDGRYSLACVTARLDGTPLPTRRPPCFMDPRHGPSVQDVMWSPDGGAARSVPVCQACAVELADGRIPAAREVPVGTAGERVPYWMAGPQYQPYAGGYYNAYGNILPALMIGTMLGGHTTVVNTMVDTGGGWMGGGGDSGGGGWMGGGGGDFGGGGGGGDFGGGGDGGGGGGF